MPAKKHVRRKVAGTVNDPSLPKTPVTIGGKVYNLCFDLGALAEAETAINAELIRRNPPQRVNLLISLPDKTLGSTRVNFAAAVRKFHPELGFEEAMGMLTLANIHDVAMAVQDAWEKSEVRPDPADPTHPGK
jgi:hypothetical protein